MVNRLRYSIHEKALLFGRRGDVCYGTPPLVPEHPVARFDFLLVGKAREPLSLERHQHLRGLGLADAFDELMRCVDAEAVEVGENRTSPDAKSVQLREEYIFTRSFVRGYPEWTWNGLCSQHLYEVGVSLGVLLDVDQMDDSRSRQHV